MKRKPKPHLSHPPAFQRTCQRGGKLTPPRRPTSLRPRELQGWAEAYRRTVSAIRALPGLHGFLEQPRYPDRSGRTRPPVCCAGFSAAFTSLVLDGRQRSLRYVPRHWHEVVLSGVVGANRLCTVRLPGWAACSKTITKRRLRRHLAAEHGGAVERLGGPTCSVPGGWVHGVRAADKSFLRDRRRAFKPEEFVVETQQRARQTAPVGRAYKEVYVTTLAPLRRHLRFERRSALGQRFSIGARRARWFLAAALARVENPLASTEEEPGSLLLRSTRASRWRSCP
jgi:hypothetical protein